MTDPLNAAAHVPPTEIIRLLRLGAEGFAALAEVSGKIGRVDQVAALRTQHHEFRRTADALEAIPVASPRAWRTDEQVKEIRGVLREDRARFAHAPHNFEKALDALCDAVQRCGPVTHEGT